MADWSSQDWEAQSKPNSSGGETFNNYALSESVVGGLTAQPKDPVADTPSARYTQKTRNRDPSGVPARRSTGLVISQRKPQPSPEFMMAAAQHISDYRAKSSAVPNTATSHDKEYAEARPGVTVRHQPYSDDKHSGQSENPETPPSAWKCPACDWLNKLDSFSDTRWHNRRALLPPCHSCGTKWRAGEVLAGPLTTPPRAPDSPPRRYKISRAQTMKDEEKAARSPPVPPGIPRPSTYNFPQADIIQEVQCVVCLDDFAASRTPKLRCGHHMCSTCIKTIFKRAAKEPQERPPKCCSHPIPMYLDSPENQDPRIWDRTRFQPQALSEEEDSDDDRRHKSRRHAGERRYKTRSPESLPVPPNAVISPPPESDSESYDSDDIYWERRHRRRHKTRSPEVVPMPPGAIVSPPESGTDSDDDSFAQYREALEQLPAEPSASPQPEERFNAQALRPRSQQKLPKKICYTISEDCTEHRKLTQKKLCALSSRRPRKTSHRDDTRRKLKPFQVTDGEDATAPRPIIPPQLNIPSSQREVSSRYDGSDYESVWDEEYSEIDPDVPPPLPPPIFRPGPRNYSSDSRDEGYRSATYYNPAEHYYARDEGRQDPQTRMSPMSVPVRRNIASPRKFTVDDVQYSHTVVGTDASRQEFSSTSAQRRKEMLPKKSSTRLGRSSTATASSRSRDSADYVYTRASEPYGEASDEDEIFEVAGRTYVLPARSRASTMQVDGNGTPGGSQFKCTRCPKQFICAADLRHHWRTHTDLPPPSAEGLPTLHESHMPSSPRDLTPSLAPSLSNSTRPEPDGRLHYLLNSTEGGKKLKQRLRGNAGSMIHGLRQGGGLYEPGDAAADPQPEPQPETGSFFHAASGQAPVRPKTRAHFAADPRYSTRDNNGTYEQHRPSPRYTSEGHFATGGNLAKRAPQYSESGYSWA